MEKKELTTCMGKKPFPFMKLRWPFIFVSLFFIGMSAYEIVVNGLNLGIDFKGGVKILYRFNEPTPIEKIREAAESTNLGGAEVIQFGGAEDTNQYLVRVKDTKGKDVASLLNQKIQAVFGVEKVEILSQEVVGPKVGHDLQNKAYLSIFLT
ncbi:MAG: hypothetical protein HQM16_13260, partial [Deltaproteobacteria bacterium]|nr:hypothetical protein [Deltaproteobacteria bacterium]